MRTSRRCIPDSCAPRLLHVQQTNQDTRRGFGPPMRRAAHAIREDGGRFVR
jgi:hypothetical protein